jgi:hypothetical protein
MWNLETVPNNNYTMGGFHVWEEDNVIQKGLRKMVATKVIMAQTNQVVPPN